MHLPYAIDFYVVPLSSEGPFNGQTSSGISGHIIEFKSRRLHWEIYLLLQKLNHRIVSLWNITYVIVPPLLVVISSGDTIMCVNRKKRYQALFPYKWKYHIFFWGGGVNL